VRTGPLGERGLCIEASGLPRPSGFFSALSGSAALGAAPGSALVFRETAPYAVLLVGFHCPVEALGDDFTLLAYCFGVFDLVHGRTGCSYGEEQFWVFVQAACLGSLVCAHVRSPPFRG
jgi:hypothetical protein